VPLHYGTPSSQRTYRHAFSKVLSIVALYRKSSSALTFENARSQALELRTRQEQMRGGELEGLEERVAWQHDQTRKGVERRELDVKGHCQDIVTLSTQLDEAQTECAYSFACLDKLCVTLAEQV
jgi:hypothetical protein